MISKARTPFLAKRAIQNQILNRPFCVSFELTHCCNAKCKHCHLRGQIEETKASPERLGEICRQVKPVVAQLSGGEPLLRKDLEDIVRAIRRPNRAPYVDITTNGTLLTKKKYYKLLEAGIDQIIVSLDYPDDRHDSFRGVPGLFNRIETLITGLGSKKDKSITLSCVVQSDNFRDLIRMVELANGWAYTWLRTDDKHFIPTRQQLREFRPIVAQLITLRDKYNNVFTSPYILSNMIKFFENQSVPNCQAGVKFLIVNPDGTMSPCGLRIRDYKSQEELRKSFSCHNSCASCHTSLRANSEKPVSHLIRDNLRVLRTY
jgi:MoaA/NifB/PqqE/SkfB family radical SAM enzyme